MELFFRNVGTIIGTLRAEYRQLTNRYFGRLEHIPGNAREVCETTIERLWQGDFYRTSLGHFDFFWMRDFGTVAESLTVLGHGDKVRHTLKWALRYYRRAGAVTLCIDQAGNTFNAPAKSIDALPWLMHSLVVCDYPLNKSERVFLERQLRKFVKTFLIQDSGDIQRLYFGEMRDAVLYDRSAYALALVGRMAKCVKILELRGFPYDPELYTSILNNHYWSGDYFDADIWTRAFSAECALMPFFLGVINDKAKINKTFDYINRHKLNDPYPLRYTNHPEIFRYRFGMGKILMPNYTGTTIWSWHGAFYLHLLKRYKRIEYETQYQKFSAMIERHGSFPEMLGPDGEWYYSPIYRGDPGMVWAALYLEL